MKKRIPFTACITALIAFTFGCSKSGGKTTILGKWRLVSDSSWQGVGPRVNLTVNTGTANDYWDFRTDGHVYVQEGAEKDTLAYKVKFFNSITIQNFGWVFYGEQTPGKILELTPHVAVIESNTTMTYGGVNFRKLCLNR